MAYFTYNGKKCYYTESGEGQPLLFLHGNTASSKMPQMIAPLYEQDFRCIFLDFLGNGQSERVEEFPTDLYVDEGRQAAALLRHLDCGKAVLLGSSGGAWAAMNTALMAPELVRAVIADSFDGRTFGRGFAEALTAERKRAKAQEQARQFYAWCQGEDWEQVVDKDTEALRKCAAKNAPLYLKPLTEMEVPVFLLGSLEDTMCRENLAQEYAQMAQQIPEAEICMFEKGGHPALFSNAEEAARSIRRFLQERKGGR